MLFILSNCIAQSKLGMCYLGEHKNIASVRGDGSMSSMSKLLENKVKEVGLSNTNDVCTYINRNLQAFMESNKPLKELSFYVIVKKVGKAVVYKTVRGCIICDKLDSGYTNSRELIGLESWNVQSVLKISPTDLGSLVFKKINFSHVQKHLFNIVEPAIIDYAVYCGEGFKKISLSEDITQGMSYENLVDVIGHVVRPASKGSGGDIGYFIVDYA